MCAGEDRAEVDRYAGTGSQHVTDLMELQTVRHREGKMPALELGETVSREGETAKTRQPVEQIRRGHRLEVWWGAMLGGTGSHL